MTTCKLETIAETREGYGRLVALAPDGHSWASASERRLQLGRDGQLTHTVTAPEPVLALLFGADSKLFACPNIYDGSANDWVALPPVEVGADEDPFDLVACALAPDGRQLLAVARHTAPDGEDESSGETRERLLLLDARSLATVAELASGWEQPRALALGDRFAAAAGVAITVWDRRTHEQLAELTGHRLVVRRLAICGDGRRLIAAGADGLVTCWDTASWTLSAAWETGSQGVSALAVAGERVATGDADGRLQIWSLDAPGQLVAAAELGGSIDDLAWSGERLLAAIRFLPARLLLLSTGA